MREPSLFQRAKISLFAASVLLFGSFTLRAETTKVLPEFLYSIQMGAFETELEAAGCRDVLIDEGFEPVRIQVAEGSHPFKVVVGDYDAYVPALLDKNEINRTRGVGAFVVKTANESGLEAAGRCRIPIQPFLDMATPLSASPLETDEPCAARLEIIQLTEDKAYDTARARMETIRAEADPGDTIRGWVDSRLAGFAHREEDYSTALELWLQVGEGKVPATREVRVASLFSVGDLHSRLKERETAYRAFSELVDLLGDDPAMQCRALTRLAGLSMELARSAKGTAGEFRRLCERAMAMTPVSPEMKQFQATASLMRLESYHMMDADYPKAIALGVEHLETFPEFAREREFVLFFMGKSHSNLGNHDQAIACFSRIVEEDLTVPNQFAKRDTKAAAQMFLAYEYLSMDDHDRALLEADKLVMNPSSVDLGANKAAQKIRDRIEYYCNLDE